MNEQFSIFTIAKKEIMDNTRNVNIIIVTFVFAAITVLVSFLGTLGETGDWQDLETTIQFLMFFIQFLVPIIGLMLGYASIVGEIERGTMSALLSDPVTRLEIILGKFLGLGLVLSISVFVGFLAAGLYISLQVSNFDFGLYFLFIIFTILLGLVFISISMFFSSLLKKRSQSIGLSIFTWSLFSFLWGMLIFMLKAFSRIPDEEAGGYFAINIFSPVQSFLCLISVNIREGGLPMPSMGLSVSNYYPDFYNNGVLLTILLLWIIVPLVLAYISFNRRDI